MSAATRWKQYVGAYHDFWDYLEEHEEVLQKEKNVNCICRIMEECPVINFSCVRDLTYTMRQFLGEKRFKKKESWWREHLESKIEECIESISSTDEEQFMAYKCTADLGKTVNSNIFPEESLTSYEMELCIATVQKEFTRIANHLAEKQDCLKKISDWSYNSQVYGQDIYRQQALILNFNILHTFCHNLVIYYKVKTFYCGTILRTIFREAFDPEVTDIQAPDRYVPPLDDCYDVHAQFCIDTRISIWPLQEPVVSSYDDRKVALSQRWGNSEPLKFMPPIYIPDVQVGVVTFLKTTGDEVTKRVNFDSIPYKIAESRHFARVMEIVQSEKYDLNRFFVVPTRKSNWLYYCVMFDPTVSSEAADQGYIGMTTRDPVTRWKELARLKDKSVIEYNLALVSQYAWLRGEDLSEYVAVFALGTTAASKLGRIKGKLIRETSEGGFTVGNMKYGMNDKRAAQKD